MFGSCHCFQRPEYCRLIFAQFCTLVGHPATDMQLDVQKLQFLHRCHTLPGCSPFLLTAQGPKFIGFCGDSSKKPDKAKTSNGVEMLGPVRLIERATSRRTRYGSERYLQSIGVQSLLNKLDDMSIEPTD